jgi:hypothetical protein
LQKKHNKEKKAFFKEPLQQENHGRQSGRIFSSHTCKALLLFSMSRAKKDRTKSVRPFLLSKKSSFFGDAVPEMSHPRALLEAPPIPAGSASAGFARRRRSSDSGVSRRYSFFRREDPVTRRKGGSA